MEILKVIYIDFNNHQPKENILLLWIFTFHQEGKIHRRTYQPVFTLVFKVHNLKHKYSI